MKHYNKILCICVYLLFSLLASCSLSSPEFLRMENFKKEKLNLKEIIISADLVCSNPNNIEVQLANIDLDVEIDDKYIGKATQIKNVRIKPNDEFTIPIRIRSETVKLLNQDLFGSALKTLKNRKIDILYKGKLTLMNKDSEKRKITIPVYFPYEMDLSE